MCACLAQETVKPLPGVTFILKAPPDFAQAAA